MRLQGLSVLVFVLVRYFLCERLHVSVKPQDQRDKADRRS